MNRTDRFILVATVTLFLFFFIMKARGDVSASKSLERIANVMEGTK